MKLKIIYITLIIWLSTISIYAQKPIVLPEYDKLLHGTVSFSMVTLIVGWEKKFLGIKEDYGIGSVGIPILTNVFKEIHDCKGNFTQNKHSWQDIRAGMIGAVFGKMISYTIYF